MTYNQANGPTYQKVAQSVGKKPLNAFNIIV